MFNEMRLNEMMFIRETAVRIQMYQGLLLAASIGKCN